MSDLPSSSALLAALLTQQELLRAELREVRALLEERRSDGPAQADVGLVVAIRRHVGDAVFSAAELVMHARLPQWAALAAAIQSSVGALNARKLGQRLKSLEGCRLRWRRNSSRFFRPRRLRVGCASFENVELTSNETLQNNFGPMLNNFLIKRNAMQYRRLSELTRESRGDPVGHVTYKWVWLLMKHQGNLTSAAEEAGRFRYSAPTLQDHMKNMQKAAVSGATPGDSAWAGNLTPDAVHDEWIAKQSSLGAYGAFLQRATRVPFVTRTIVDSGEPTAGFVGRGRAIPLAKLSLDGTTTLPRLKVGLVIAFTKELTQAWNPASLANLEDRMDTAATRGTDQALLDPNIAEVQERNPASLLNGVSQLSSAGTSAANMATDIKTLVQPHLDNGADPQRLLIVAHPTTALAQSLSDHQTFKIWARPAGALEGLRR